MSENIKYMVVITGKALPSHNIANVRNNVALRFNMQDARVDKMFSGRPVAVKRNMDLEAAKKFKDVFAQLGAECLVMEEKSAQGQPAPKKQPKKAGPPPKSPEELRKEIFAGKVKKQFEHLDAQYVKVGFQSGFEKMSVVFSILMVLAIAGIGAAWHLLPQVTWYMAVPGMLLALIIFSLPLMKSQQGFLKKAVAALVDKNAEDLALSLACLDSWLDRMDNQRHAKLIRKELDKVIGRHSDQMEKMMDYAYNIAEVVQKMEEEEAKAREILPAPPEPKAEAPQEAGEENAEQALEPPPAPNPAKKKKKAK